MRTRSVLRDYESSHNRERKADGLSLAYIGACIMTRVVMIVATTSVYTFFYRGIPIRHRGSDVKDQDQLGGGRTPGAFALITPGNDCIPEAVTGRWVSRSREDPCRRYKVKLLISSQG
jgi:hypothetical protein